MPKPMAKSYDPDTQKFTMIPMRELSDAMIATTITGVEGTVYIDRKNLKVGDVIHKELPSALVDRVKKIAVVFADVLPDSLEKWLEDFRRDENPEPEVKIWERIAGKYLLLTEPSDPLTKRKDVVLVLLQCSSNSAIVARLTAECKKPQQGRDRAYMRSLAEMTSAGEFGQSRSSTMNWDGKGNV